MLWAALVLSWIRGSATLFVEGGTCAGTGPICCCDCLRITLGEFPFLGSVALARAVFVLNFGFQDEHGPCCVCVEFWISR